MEQQVARQPKRARRAAPEQAAEGEEAVEAVVPVDRVPGELVEAQAGHQASVDEPGITKLERLGAPVTECGAGLSKADLNAL
eukprot:4880537-Heterocapsa_arctica.AAC.1